jgi:hypothetical protein
MNSVAELRERLRLDRLAPRDRRAVLLGLAVLLPALLYGAAVRPWYHAVAELRDRSAAERALLERELALLAGAPMMPAVLERASDAATRAELRLVRAANVPLAEAELIQYLESVASISRVLLQELRGVEPARGAAEPLPGMRPIRLAVRGESDLEGVVTFLSRVEESPLLLRVAGLSIEPVTERAPAEGRGNARGNPRAAPAPTGVIRFGLVIEGYAPPESRTAGRATLAEETIR